MVPDLLGGLSQAFLGLVKVRGDRLNRLAGLLLRQLSRLVGGGEDLRRERCRNRAGLGSVDDGVDERGVHAQHGGAHNLEARREGAVILRKIGAEDFELAHGFSAGHARVRLVDVLLDESAHRGAGRRLRHAHRLKAVGLQPGVEHSLVERHDRGNERASVSKHHGLGDDGALLDGLFQWLGRHVLATGGDDDVLFATGDRDVSVVVDRRKVSGAQPAIVEGLGGALGIVLVAEERHAALDLKLVVVSESCADAGAGAANGADLVEGLRVDDAGRGRLGHAIALNERDVIQAIEEMRKVLVDRGAAACQPMKVGTEGGAQ